MHHTTRAGLVAFLTLVACAVPTPTPARPLATPPPVTATVRLTPTPLAALVPTKEPAVTQTLPQPTIGEAVVDSPQWPVLGFLRGWQARDFGAMAVATGAVGDAKAPATTTMANRYDFRPLRGAEIVAVDRLGPAAARVSARVWFEFPPGQVQQKRLALMLERGPTATWTINPASTSAESADP